MVGITFTHPRMEKRGKRNRKSIPDNGKIFYDETKVF